jgi:hypothetical protein
VSDSSTSSYAPASASSYAPASEISYFTEGSCEASNCSGTNSWDCSVSSIAIPDTRDADRRHNRKHEDTRIEKQLYNIALKYLYALHSHHYVRIIIMRNIIKHYMRIIYIYHVIR